MKKKRIYFDYNATTPLHPNVIKAMRDAEKYYGNPSSLHARGREAKAIVENARADIAAFIGTEREHIVFTASGSEANNQVVKTILFESLQSKVPGHIISTAIEHSSIREALGHCKKMGVEVSIVGCDATGQVRVEDIVKEIKPNTQLISVQMANNEVGTLQPIKDIADAIKGKNILFHTDAVQAAGKIKIDVKELGVDFLTLGAHKLYGPKGIGALYVRDDSTLFPLVSGSSHERKLRAGTEAVQPIVGFAKAITLLHKPIDNSGCRDYLVTAVKKVCPTCVIHTPLNNAISNTLSIGFPNVDGHALAINLDLAGIEVSTGSACSAGSVEPSPVLRAMGVSDALNLSSIRISLGRETTYEDCDYFIEILKNLF